MDQTRQRKSDSVYTLFSPGLSDLSNSNHVQFAMAAGRRASTLSTNPVNFQTVARHTKTVVSCDGFQCLRNHIIAEFNQRIALFTNEMIVLWITIIMFVHFAVVAAGNLANQTGIFQMTDCSVDCRSTYPSPANALFRQSCDNLIGFKVLVIREDLTDDDVTFLSQPHSPSFEVFPEFFHGCG